MTLTTGQIDPTFGENGRLEVRPPGNFYNDLSNVTTDASGRLSIYGSYEREAPTTPQPGVARLTDKGAFDTGFGDLQDGLTSVPTNIMASSVSSIAQLADGSFFITGAANSQLPLINYDHDGKFISSWDIAEGQHYTAPQLLALGDTFLVTSANANGGIVYRRHVDGAVDGSFGNEGQVTFLTGNNYVSTLHLARSNNNASFYLAGEVGNDGFILRMTHSGELDQGFADGGIYSVRMVDARLTACRRVIELSDGKVLALVNSSDFETGAASHLIRLTATGRVDATFNRGEPLRVPGDVGEDLALQADGKILVVHRGLSTGNVLTRYFPGGGLDLEFGNDESGSITFTDEQISFVKSVAVQADGKIVVGGASGSITVLLRLLA